MDLFFYLEVNLTLVVKSLNNWDEGRNRQVGSFPTPTPPLDVFFILLLSVEHSPCMYGRGWVRQRCGFSYFTVPPSGYWFIIGQGLLFLQRVRVEGGKFLFLLFLQFHSFSFLPYPSLSSLLSLSSCSLGDDTKCPTRVDMSLKPNIKLQVW